MMRSTTTWILPAVTLAALLAVVWRDPLLTRRNFAGRDLVAYNLPMEKTIHDAYARGHWPLWSPDVSGGRPLLPNPNAGALYPMRILLAPLRFPVAAKVFPVLHWIAGGLGMLALARALALSAAAGWMMAVTYGLCGVVVSEVYFPHLLPGTALLPWIAFLLARRGRVVPRAVGLSLCFALGMLAGEIFTFAMAILVCAAWITVGADRASRRSLVVLVASALCVAALACLPQILATLLWIPETNRGVMGIKWGEALQFTVSPYRLLELVIPYPFGPVYAGTFGTVWGPLPFGGKAGGLFLTLYGGVLVPVACVVTRRSKSAVVRFGRVLALVAAALCVPWRLMPEAWLDRQAPLALRNPEKFAILLAFGLAILAGAGLDELRRRDVLPAWIPRVGMVLGALAIVASGFPAGTGRVASALTLTPDDAGIAARQLPMALTEAALLWIAGAAGLALVRSDRRGVAVAGLAALTLVPVVATRRIAWTFREDEVFAPPAFVRFLQKHDPANRFRALGETPYLLEGPENRIESGFDIGALEIVRRDFDQHTQALWNRGAVFNGDFDNGDLSRVQSLRMLSSDAERLPAGRTFFGSLSLRWGIRYRSQTPPLLGFRHLRDHGLDSWDENPSALPAVRLASRWSEERDVLSALRRMGNLEWGEIVVESGQTARDIAPPGNVRVRAEAPERVVLETRSAVSAWLFVLRGFWRHRTVRVDGHPVDVFPAQLAFSAIRVPAGDHTVEWIERWPGLPVSRFGPLAALAAVGLLFALSSRLDSLDPRQVPAASDPT